MVRKNKIAVFTASIGQKMNSKQFRNGDKFDYYIFTDDIKNIKTSRLCGVNIVKVDSNGDNFLCSRKIKFCVTDFIDDYDFFVYIDNNAIIQRQFERKIEKIIYDHQNSDIIFQKHPRNDNIEEEIQALSQRGITIKIPNEVENQNLPIMTDNSFFLRRNNVRAKSYFDNLYYLLTEKDIKRDQVASVINTHLMQDIVDIHYIQNVSRKEYFVILLKWKYPTSLGRNPVKIVLSVFDHYRDYFYAKRK